MLYNQIVMFGTLQHTRYSLIGKYQRFGLFPDLIRQAPDYTVRRKFSEDIFP